MPHVSGPLCLSLSQLLLLVLCCATSSCLCARLWCCQRFPVCVQVSIHTCPPACKKFVEMRLSGCVFSWECVCLSNDERHKEDWFGYTCVCVNGYVVGILSATPMRPHNLPIYQLICLIHSRPKGSSTEVAWYGLHVQVSNLWHHRLCPAVPPQSTTTQDNPYVPAWLEESTLK